MVITVFEDSDGAYGYRRVCAAAARRGWPADPHTMRKIIREHGLTSAWTRRRRPRTTIPAAGDYPDLIKRDSPPPRLAADYAAQTIDRLAALIDIKAGLVARALDGSDEEGSTSADVQLEALVAWLTDTLRA